MTRPRPTLNAPVYWIMSWDQTRFPHKPPQDLQFEPELALAHLLLDDVVHLNTHWWEQSWPEAGRNTFYIGAFCNDVFAWATAESEAVTMNTLQSLYDFWRADPEFGPVRWCAIQRRELPQEPFCQHMRERGQWDAVMEAIGTPQQDAVVTETLTQLRQRWESEWYEQQTAAAEAAGRA